MSTYTPAPHSFDGRTSLTVATAKRGLAIMATLSLAAGSVAAQATDVPDAPTDFGRLALAFGVLLAIVLIKVWANADKRGKLMDRLSAYLASRAARRAHHAMIRVQDGAVKGDKLGSALHPQGVGTSSAAVAQPAARSVIQPGKVIHVLPVPGLPPRMQYLSD